MTRLRLSASILVVLAIGGLAGCSSGDDSSTCADLQNLYGEVNGLIDLKPLQVGAEGIQDQLDDVQAAWDTAKKSAGSEFGSELDSLESSVQTLVEEVKSFDGEDSSLSQNIDQLKTDIEAVGTSLDDLTSAVESELSDCTLDSDASQ